MLDFDARQNLRWLLLRGAKHNIYVMASIDKEHAHTVQDWIQGFKTEIWGDEVIDYFEMKEGDHMIKFWTPETNI